MRPQQLTGALHHPAVDSGHELIAFGRRQEFSRRNDFTAIAQHADQQLESWPSVVAAQRQNGLGVQSEAVGVQRIPQLADDQYVGVAANDAVIGILEHLDTIAAAVLGGFAGDFRGRQCVRQRIVGAPYRRHAHAHRHLEGTLSGARYDGGGGGPNQLGDFGGAVHGGAWE